MEKMTDGMLDAAKTAGISTERAEEIYRMEVLVREFFQSDYVNLNMTFTETSWLVDVHAILAADHGTFDPKSCHRFERKTIAKERIENAIFALLGEEAIYAPENKLEALAAGLNELMVELFDDIKLSIDDFPEIAVKFVQRGDAQKLDV